MGCPCSSECRQGMLASVPGARPGAGHRGRASGYATLCDDDAGCASRHQSCALMSLLERRRPSLKHSSRADRPLPARGLDVWMRGALSTSTRAEEHRDHLVSRVDECSRTVREGTVPYRLDRLRSRTRVRPLRPAAQGAALSAQHRTLATLRLPAQRSAVTRPYRGSSRPGAPERSGEVAVGRVRPHPPGPAHTPKADREALAG